MELQSTKVGGADPVATADGTTSDPLTPSRSLVIRHRP
jgi:hypothetical protein